jgi:hypothetical protein
VERVAAAVADCGVRVGEDVAADVARGSHQLSVLGFQSIGGWSVVAPLVLRVPRDEREGMWVAYASPPIGPVCSAHSFDTSG